MKATNGAVSDIAAAINDSWRQWIAENKLLRASDPSMIDALVRNGIADTVARQEVEAATRNPYLQGADWVAQRQAKTGIADELSRIRRLKEN